MYFAEPQPTPLDLNFTFFGIPVRVSPWFWLGSAIFGFQLAQQDIKLLFLWEVAVFVSILLHEMGHAVVMRRLGDRPRIVLYLVGGLAISDRGYRGSSYNDQIAISAAGPLTQLFLAALCLGVVRASGHAYPGGVPFWNDNWYDLTGRGLDVLPYQNLNVFLYFMMLVNFFWALFNLLPVWPLDGGQITRSVMDKWNTRDGIRQSLMVSAIAGAVVGVYGFKEGQMYMGMMFAALAFDSFQTYQGIRGRW